MYRRPLITGEPFELARESEQARGLIAWYPDGTGSDFSQSRNHLKRWAQGAAGGAVIASQCEGRIDTAIGYLNGTSHCVQERSSSIQAKLQAVADLSVECWVYVVPNSNFAGIITLCTTNAYVSGCFLLRLHSNNFAQFSVYATSPQTANSIAAFPTRKWTHVVGVYSNTGNFVKLYLDGVDQGGGIAAAGAFTSLTGNLLLIGQHYPAYNNYFLEGVVEDVRIYDRALSAAEVADHFRNPVGLRRPIVRVSRFIYAPLPQTLTPGTVAAAHSTVTAPTLTPGAVSVTVPVIAPDTSLSAPTLGRVLDVSAVIRPNTFVTAYLVLRPEPLSLAVGVIAPDVTVLDATLIPAGYFVIGTISPDTALTAPSVTCGDPYVSVPVIAPDITVSGPDIFRGTTFQPAVISPSHTTVTAPSIVVGTRSLSPGVILPNVVVTAPSLTLVGAILPGTIAPDISVLTPTVRKGRKTITVPTVLTSATTVTAPDIHLTSGIFVPVIRPTTAVTAPAVVSGAISISISDVVGPDVTVTGPDLVSVLSLSLDVIAPDVVVTAPDVLLNQPIGVIAPDVVVTAPTLVAGAISLTPGVIGPVDSAVSGPDLIAVAVLTIDVIAPDVTVSPVGLSIAGQGIPGMISPRTAVSAPTVLGGAITVSVDGVISPDVVVEDVTLAASTALSPGVITPDITLTAPDVSKSTLVSVESIIIASTVTAPDITASSGIVIEVGLTVANLSISSPAVHSQLTRSMSSVIAPDVVVTGVSLRSSPHALRIWTL